MNDYCFCQNVAQKRQLVFCCAFLKVGSREVGVRGSVPLTACVDVGVLVLCLFHVAAAGMCSAGINQFAFYRQRAICPHNAFVHEIWSYNLVMNLVMNLVVAIPRFGHRFSRFGIQGLALVCA